MIETDLLRVMDLGRLPYEDAFEMQLAHHAEVLAAREREGGEVGRLLLLEHDPPVITVSRRRGARAHLVAGDEELRRAGVEVCETDRGGDITYHGPGQLVAYPILDLNRLALGLHAYMRMLEEIVIAVCARYGVEAGRDPAATGVWVGVDGEAGASSGAGKPPLPPGGAKICAMGIRVRRWVTLHGLALNVTTDLTHFDLIVPCGLAGRSVTSLERELGEACPSMRQVKRSIAEAFVREVEARRAATPG